MSKIKTPILGLLTVYILFISCSLSKTKSKESRPLRWTTKKEALNYLTKDMADIEQFKKDELKPLLIERISGTENNVKVRQHIVGRLQQLGWTVEEDSFESNTPFGHKNFTNIIATQDVNRPQKVILACHFDSKDLRTKQGQTFIGATDSAVPCAILLETAKQLDCLLKKGPKPQSPGEHLTLQLVFFDGEEAFEEWSATDSLYGSRHLAAKWEEESKLSNIREMILLDLIGTKDTHFINYFPATTSLYENLMKIEKHLKNSDFLTGKRSENIFASMNSYVQGGVADDHIPFLNRGVEVLHLISSPFPSVWHTVDDNGQNLDYNLIDDFSRIFRVFLSNLLHLAPENIGCRRKVWHTVDDNGKNLDYNLIDDFSRIFRVFVSNLLHLARKHKPS